jgi:hypothetical protein
LRIRRDKDLGEWATEVIIQRILQFEPNFGSQGEQAAFFETKPASKSKTVKHGRAHPTDGWFVRFGELRRTSGSTRMRLGEETAFFAKQIIPIRTQFDPDTIMFRPLHVRLLNFSV